MTAADLFWFLLLALPVGYWLDVMRVTEAARAIGRKACRDVGVLFLDDSVVVSKIRLRHDDGRFRLYREFRFEFTGDGNRRSAGCIQMLGKRLQKVQLEAYPIPTPETDSLH